MMKWILIVLLAVSVCMPVPYALAESGSQRKGASEQAYEHASDEAIFHRVGDWFATIGKNKDERQQIVAERRAARSAKRAQKKLEKAKKKAKRGTRQLESNTKNAAKGSKAKHKGIGY